MGDWVRLGQRGHEGAAGGQPRAGEQRTETCLTLPALLLTAGGLDFSSPVKKFFYDPLGSGRSFVNCAVSLTGFALVGGPARQDAPKVRGWVGGWVGACSQAATRGRQQLLLLLPLREARSPAWGKQ